MARGGHAPPWWRDPARGMYAAVGLGAGKLGVSTTTHGQSLWDVATRGRADHGSSIDGRKRDTEDQRRGARCRDGRQTMGQKRAHGGQAYGLPCTLATTATGQATLSTARRPPGEHAPRPRKQRRKAGKQIEKTCRGLITLQQVGASSNTNHTAHARRGRPAPRRRTEAARHTPPPHATRHTPVKPSQLPRLAIACARHPALAKPTWMPTATVPVAAAGGRHSQHPCPPRAESAG